MTIKELRDSLALIGKGHDSKEVVVWLPGSKIDLGTSLFFRGDEINVEGNVRPGSALYAE